MLGSDFEILYNYSTYYNQLDLNGIGCCNVTYHSEVCWSRFTNSAAITSSVKINI